MFLHADLTGRILVECRAVLAMQLNTSNHNQQTNKQTNKQTQSVEDVGYLADACLSECVVVVAGIARYK